MFSRRTVIRLLWLEVAFFMAYDCWLGPAYLSGLAGELGLDLGFVSVFAAVPWIGASGQLLGAWLFERSTSVRRYVLWVAALSRGMWAIPVALAIYWGAKSALGGARFPAVEWFSVAAVCACLSSLLGSASGNAWMYWMKNLIPRSFYGRFFGCRTRYSTAAFVVASVIGASIVGFKPGGYWVGYLVLGVLAIAAGVYSLTLLAKVPDLRSAPATGCVPRPLREIIEAPLRDREFRKLLAFGASFQGSMQLASSYFPYYFTHDLGISMSSIALWGGATNFGAFISARFWGAHTDRSQSSWPVLWWTGHCIAVAPLAYVVRDARLVETIAPFEYFFNGIVWSGFTLAQTKLLIQLSPQGKGAAYFSVYAAAMGITGASCTFVGGQLARVLLPLGGFQVLWGISAAARLTVLWTLCRPHVAGALQPVFRYAGR